ncbi:Ribonuclease H domain [Macleaya cordata]|uniref:Ribonuclease H domain n=1 Tax=Macleaya cordata TaxID=56857 RepID=A0A200Q6M1_MACCD|nr:Ribonuclease H domain [Macleaya cordata]
MLVYWQACFMLPKRVYKELNSMFRRFLWAGIDLTPKHSTIGWETVCGPYKEGGLAVRHLECTNKAANLRHIWEIISDKDTLWVSWVKKNLIKHKDFWSMNTPNEASWSWRKILEMRPLARKLSLHLVGNGYNIKFWTDHWHPLGVLEDRFPVCLQYDSILHKNASVDSCISSGAWRIPIHLVNNIPEIAYRVHEVEIDSSSDDHIVWMPSADGSFNLKDTYEYIQPVKSEVAWTSLVKYQLSIPRHSFITWVALHRGLKTKYKLFLWGVEIDPTCPLCQISAEDDYHLIFGCPYSEQVWMPLLRKIGHLRLNFFHWDFEIQWCIKHFQGNDSSANIKKLVFNAYVYHIWHERNNRVFNNGCTNPKGLVWKIVRDVNLKLAAHDLKFVDTDRNRSMASNWNCNPTFTLPKCIFCPWERPEADKVMVNTDGSLKTDIAGYGAIVRDRPGNVLAAVTGSSNPRSITLHEFQGVEAGLLLAASRGLRRISVRSDSMVVVSILNSSITPPWHTRAVYHRIKMLVSRFDHCDFRHVFRETNRAADHLASLYPTAEYHEVLPSSFAEDMKKIVFEDSVGKMYRRSIV